VGTDEYGLPALPDAAAALRALGHLTPKDAVLVKASRAAGLERLAEQLLTGAADATADAEQANTAGRGDGAPRSGGGRGWGPGRAE
jgi:hypothetical protein